MHVMENRTGDGVHELLNQRTEPRNFLCADNSSVN